MQAAVLWSPPPPPPGRLQFKNRREETFRDWTGQMLRYRANKEMYPNI